MAAAPRGSGLAEDLLCPVCLSLFRDPRVLACGHSFCAPCLEPCVPRGQRQGPCPTCRQPFTLRSVAVNWALSSLAGKARTLKLDEEAQLGGGGPGGATCPEHDEPLKLFCRQDQDLVCVICRDLPQHRGHGFLPVKNAVQACQDKLKAALVPLKERLDSATEDQHRQQENIAELESRVQDLSGYISKEFEVLHQILREKEEGMKQEVERLKKENHEEMEEKLKELDEEVTTCGQTLARAQAGLDMADHTAFLRGIKELMRSVREEDRDDEGGISDEDEDVANGEEAEEEEETDDEGGSSEEDEDVANGEGEEAEEEQEEDGDDEDEEDWNIVAVDASLQAFKDSLDFEAWQEMLGTIQAESQIHVKVTPDTYRPTSCRKSSVRELTHVLGPSAPIRNDEFKHKDAKALMERVHAGQGAQGKEVAKPKALEMEEALRTRDDDTDEREKEEEGEEEEDDGVVPVDLNLGEVKGPLQFYVWKELLGIVHPACITLDCHSDHPSTHDRMN